MHVLGELQLAYQKLRLLHKHGRVHLGKRVAIQGTPIIDARRGTRIVIGDDVTLNSSNRGYHVNMHSPVKLFADRTGATISIGERTRIHGLRG